MTCRECSGLLAYRELIDAGFEKVKIFERDAVPGGIWHYTEDTPVEAPVPNQDPRIADYVPSLPPRGTAMPLEKWYADHNDSITTAERWRRHRAPHGVWASLTSNVPAVRIFLRERNNALNGFAAAHACMW